MTRQEILDLKKQFGINKVIPAKYEIAILSALSAFPELKTTRIHFKLTNHHSVPYGTTPTFASLFKPAHKRIYYVTLLEEAKEPERGALFRNLPHEAQVAVIAHELTHVVQFNSQSVPVLLKTMLLYPVPFFKKIIERGADKGAIEHGYGRELYKHAVYLRNIPGYVEKRPAIDKYYLKPYEILEIIKKRELI